METETFQHYRVLRREDGSLWELGRGAMAVTYKAFDVNLDCPVALKVVNARSLEDDHTRARYVREAQAAAMLRHRNIASVYHLGSDEQSYFYAMEFVDGETVENLVARRGPLPAAEALGIVAQVARALGAAARQGLVHRDIKPANLMVSSEDEDDDGARLVKVIDFGLARRARTDATAQITRFGFVGTPQYASPEQIEERDLDTRSDLYSLGVTLWFMLTGRPTFGGPAAQVGAHHLHGEPPWATVAHLPAPARALLARLLQKNPANRPADPAALRREVEACLAALAEGAAAIDTPRALSEIPVLASPEAETVAPAAPLPISTGAPPTIGDGLGRRFTLREVVGEGRTGRVFRASDERKGGRPVAVKVLRAEAGLSHEELALLQSDVRRLRAAPHPRLLETLVFDEAQGHWYVVSEWINGFTLVDLLRHRGSLDLPEVCQLLAQASDAAHHGTANGLSHLEFAPRQVLVNLPGPLDAGQTRSLLSQPLAKWPTFGLKINALGLPPGKIARLPTSDGSLTIVPHTTAHGRHEAMSQGGYFHPLGVLFYELLSGTPPPAESGGKREWPPLPMLNEEANDILRTAWLPRAPFRNEKAFFDALLSACHLKREDLHPGPSPAPAPARQMAPTIRTKPLRCPSSSRPHGSTSRPRYTGRLVIIVVTALITIAAGTALLVRATSRPSGSMPTAAP